MDFNKNMRAGYQGKSDSMRELADRLMNHPGSAPDVRQSKSAADTSKMRAYKDGGAIKSCASKKDKMVSSMKKDKTVQKFALGGVAKVRHEEASEQGLPRNFKKVSTKDFL